jgi:hypothetical protein
MKQKLRKSRKQYSLFKVVLYSNEGEINRGCSWDVDCNTVSGCGGRPDVPKDVNYRCNPPNSILPGANNIRCNLVANC